MAGDCNHTRGRGELWSRRDVLLYIGAITASAAGCRRRRSQPSVWTGAAISTAKAIAATPPACVVRREQTEGPYFIDEKLNRSDIRVDPSDKSAKAGVPLRLEFHVSHIGGGACTPLSGATIDMWHCDALGVYSGVQGNSGNFLRGFQRTDANGKATFQTIYPGWYQGRAVHIHFKVRTDPDASAGFEFTSQLFFDDDVSRSVYSTGVYAQKGAQDVPNAQDGIYNQSGGATLVSVTQEGDGYKASFPLAVQLT